MSSKAINLGDAGDINLNASDKIVLNNADVITSSTLSAGGEVNINAINLLALTNSGITAEAFGVTTGNDGGNINIDPINVVLNSSNIIARANAGNGGNITIVTDALTQSNDSIIDASSALGVDGVVRIESANDEVNATQYGDIGFIDILSMLTRSCNAAKAKNRSSFVVMEQGGLPASPGHFLTYQYDKTSQSENSLINTEAYLFNRISLIDHTGTCSGTGS